MAHRSENVSLLEYAFVVWRYRWLVVAVWGVSIATGVAITVASPKMYEAVVTVMPPKENVPIGFGSALAASGQVQQMLGVSLIPTAPNRDMLLSVLKSRTMAEYLIKTLALQARYEAPYLDQAIKQLETATQLYVSREGVISLKVEDTDPKMAAQIATTYISHLDELVSRFSTGDGFHRDPGGEHDGRIRKAEDRDRYSQVVRTAGHPGRSHGGAHRPWNRGVENSAP